MTSVTRPSGAWPALSLTLSRGLGRGVRIALLLAAGLGGAGSLHALRTDERLLRPNGQVEYLRDPVAAESVGQMFSHGVLHARSRTHFFGWDWENERTAGTSQSRDHATLGAGGSLIFRTARYEGWNATLGLYASVPVLAANTSAAAPLTNFARAGKDTFRAQPDGSERPLYVLAEACAEYRRGAFTARAGRQIIDTTLLASNDSKMIPNTFEAVRTEWRPRPATRLGVAWVTRQKLRDHSAFHSPIAYLRLYGNDDSGAHRGLTPQNLQAAGRDSDTPIWLLTADDRSIKNLRLTAEAVALEGLFATMVADASYEWKTSGQWTVGAGVRGLYQRDNGVGAIGGAALAGTYARDRVFTASASDRLRLAAYRDPFAATGGLWAARVSAGRGPLQLVLGTSQVADRADLIAPWRGFPSGGYTRTMAQLDWLAGTTNWTARADYDLGRNALCAMLTCAASYHRMDFDARKIEAGAVTLTDRALLSFDVTTSFRRLPRTAFKVRLGLLNADAKPATPVAIDYESYRELRFEMNHLF
jgi:hypothetical protein